MLLLNLPKSRSRLDGKDFRRGSFIVKNIDGNELNRVSQELGLQVYATNAEPRVAKHAVRAPRIAMMHTWLTTEAEGWWRIEFDRYEGSV